MCFAPQRRALFRQRIAIDSSKSGPNPRCFDTFYFKMCCTPQQRALFRHRNFQKWPERVVILAFLLRNGLRATTACMFSTSELPKIVRTSGVSYILRGNVLRATTACTFSTSHLPKVVRTWCVLYIFTYKCASRHNGVHFFHSSTSKTGPNLTCFDTFYLQMCFAPQRRALFRHPKIFRTWLALTLFTSKRASRQNGVHFFDISTSKSAPSMVCFDIFHFNMCFAPRRRALFHLSSAQMSPRPPLQRAYFWALRRHKTLENHSVSPLSYLFAHLQLLSSDFLHLSSSPSLIFSLLTFSTSEFLPGCALSISPYCRKFSFQTSFDKQHWQHK